MRPILFSIGDYPVRAFGVFFALGLLVAAFVAWYEGKRKKLPEDGIFDAVILSTIFGLFGARALHIFLNWADFTVRGWSVIPYFREGAKVTWLHQGPWFFLTFWEGGLAFFGGLFVGLMGVLVIAVFRRWSILEILDLSALSLCSGQIFGVVGSLLAGTYVGIEHSGTLSVSYNGVEAQRLPVQVFEAVAFFALAVGLFVLWRRVRKPGYTLAAYLLGLGGVKFLADYYRDDYMVVLYGLSMRQIISLCVIVIGVILIPWLLLFQELEKSPEELRKEAVAQRVRKRLSFAVKREQTEEKVLAEGESKPRRYGLSYGRLQRGTMVKSLWETLVTSVNKLRRQVLGGGEGNTEEN